MKGRQKGRPTKWVKATVGEGVWLGKPGVTFEVWEKWKRKKRKLGTLTVSVGGLRWRPNKVAVRNYRQRSWRRVEEWFDEKG
jgi:hypothetical protein